MTIAKRPLLHAFLHAGVATSALLGLPQAAWAQSTATQATGLEDIIVSARRREESIQSTPVAVSAISPTELANAAAPDIRDLVGRTPNLVIDPVNASPSAAAISIRGISFEDIEKSFDPAVGVLIDGIYIGTNTGQLLDFFDFESIEVLRGPQGTLFGRNTTAGVISITRTRPTGELGFKGKVTIGDYGRREYRTVVNAPKIADMLSLKGFWLRSEGDDYYDNQTLGEDYGGRRYDNYGATALLEIGDFEITGTYERVNERTEIDTASTSGTLTSPAGTDFICLPLALPPGFLAPRDQCDRNTNDDLYTTFTNVPGLALNEGDNVTVNASYDFGGFVLTSVTGWRSSNESVRQDFDSTSINFFDTLRVQTYRQFSQELRLSGNLTETIDFVVGGYYFNSRYTLDQSTFSGPFLSGGNPTVGGNIVDHSSKSKAIFGDLQWKLTDQLRLSAGGRYTWDEKSMTNDLSKLDNPSVVATPEADWSKFTPRASIDYSFGETSNNLVYASFSQGYRAGGLNGRAQTVGSANTPYDPETVDSYEVGFKTQFWENRITFNVAGFVTKFRDKQEEVVIPAPAPVDQETVVQNAAKATIKGLEVEMRALVAEGLTLNGSLGFLDAAYDSFNTLVNGVDTDISNRSLRRTPDLSYSVGADYAIPVGPGELQLAASYRYVARLQTTIAGAPTDPTVNDPRGLAQPRGLLDASAGYTFDLGAAKLRAAIFGRNLTDDRGLSSTLPVAGLFTFSAARPPRTWGVEFGIEF